MCEQTEVNYLDGDVVWVKLGPCWWPGEVRDISKLPPDLVKAFKKQPIAIVKFFEEDQYEYVKNINRIYKYNCRKKHEFIKKGLDMHRAKNAFMDKFPSDVCYAETLTGGDPDIITNDEFAPEQKPSYAAIFGSPSPRKTPKIGSRGKGTTGSTPKSSNSGITPQRQITHPRFLGKSDHEIRILEQSTPTAHASHYTCHICGFKSTRLNVIVLHNRSHSNGTYVSPVKNKNKKSSSKKGKRPKSFATTTSIDEDLELIRQGVVLSTEESSDSESERERDKPKSGKRKNNKVTHSATKKTKVSSICNNLLADWGDSDEETVNVIETPLQDKKDTETEKKSVHNELLADWDDKNSDDESTGNSLAVLDEKKEDTKVSEKSSCFDFEDEEENAVLEKSPGRKIPRVIPPKRISKDTDENTESGVERESESMESDVTEKIHSDKEETTNNTNEPDMLAFKSLLDETSVPDISTIADVKSSTTKISDDSSSPDKTNGVMKAREPGLDLNTSDNDNITKEPETSVAIIPKKRIVRNFEEFENLINEQKQVEEESSLNKSTLELSKLKSQLMSKLNESPNKISMEHTENLKTDYDKIEGDSQSNELLKKEVIVLDSKELDKNDSNENTFEIQTKQSSFDSVDEEKTQQEKEETVFENIEDKDKEETVLIEKSETVEITKEKSIQPESVIEDKIENFEETLKDEVTTNEKLEKDLILDEKEIKIDSKEIDEPFELKKKNDFEDKNTEKISKSEDCRSQKMLVDISDICIDNSDNMSGLSTLAAVSELTGNLYDKQEITGQKSPVVESKEESSTNDEVTTNPPSCVTDDTESRDMTPVRDEVSENSANDKPVKTLTSFSLDFSDSNSESTIIKTVGIDDVTIAKNSENIEKSVNEDSKIDTNETNTVTSMTDDVTDVTRNFESIENEIEKMTSLEANTDKVNSLPQDCISIETTGINYQDFPLVDTETTVPGQDSDNTDCSSKINETTVGTEATLESEIAKLTDTQPDSENVVQEHQQNTSSSKLLEILTDSKRTEQTQASSPSQTSRAIITSSGSQKVQMVISGDTKTIPKKFDSKTSKFVIKSASAKGAMKSHKPIILSEKIIKPMTEIENVSVKKVTSKRSYQDVEDIDTFIIQKPNKKPNSGDLDQQDIILTPKSESIKFKTGIQRGRGKPKIIEQTIIKAADVIQPVSVSASESQNILDDTIFDINSMPIVLTDQLLTPESIENIPVVMTDLIPASSGTVAVSTVPTMITTEKSHQQTVAVKRGGAIQQVKLLNKGKITSHAESSSKLSQNVVIKSMMPRGLGKNQKVYQTGSKILKNNPAVITQPGKPGKFIILPSSTTTSSGTSKYTVGKRLTTIKGSTALTTSTTSKQLKTVQSVAGEPTGNKIMIVTNQQGVQSRVLLTPAQQKMLGCKVPGTKIAKSPSQHIKGNIMQKSILTSKGTIIGSVSSSGLKSSSLASQTIVTSKGQLLTTHTPTGQTLVTSEGQVLTPITQQQLKSNIHKTGKKIQIQSSKVLLSDKIGENSQKGKMNVMGTKTKTVLIKGAQGQTLKKIHAPVNESKNIILSQAGHKSQLVSIAGQQLQGGITGKQVMVTSKGQIVKPDGKVSIPKQTIEKVQRIQSQKTNVNPSPRIVSKTSRTQVLLSPVSSSTVSSKQHSGNVTVPPLAPITGQSKKEATQSPLKQSDQKLLSIVSENKEKTVEVPLPVVENKPVTGESKQPNQLIIQDPMGNQTTVTEGQILALPSGETVDGQPQSYVLVTVDESGNLVPISNDTLMSLDPNLALGGDMNNIVLQIDQGAQENQTPEPKSTETLATDDQQFVVTNQQPIETSEQQLLVNNQQLLLSDQSVLSTEATEQQQVLQEQETFGSNTDETQVVASDTTNLIPEGQQTVACSINNGDSGQQLIITGDAESTQKFLASLSEGSTDLSSLLSGTDGNIIINTDSQQILLNADSENQILLSVNSDNLGLIQGSNEGDVTQNAMYVTQQTIKNQDILAAALADTDVFQQEAADKSTSQALTKVSSSAQPQLSPNSSLYPMNVGNVLETSLTLGSPIMTPLEVPSVNNKKISPDVESTLITQVPSSLELPITITDPSISQTVSQQVMLGNDLQTNLELPISISENTITSIRSSEMNSPNFVYTLPSLDENSDLEQKRVFTETSTVITTDNIYNTSLTGSMSMPLLTEEPEITPEDQEQITNQEETPIVTSASETSITETEVSTDNQNTNFPSLNTENLPTSITEKMPTELQIPIEEELELNPTDICSSLSEPPPGMFDKSTFSNYLNNKEEEESNNISIPTESTETEVTTVTSETSVLNEEINSLPISDGAGPEQEAASSVTEKIVEESNLDMDYGESSDQQSISETIITQDVQQSELSETPNSELNSPQLDIDESSVELPIQPPIITNLSENFSDNPSDKKRANEDNEDDNEVKRTKLSCD